MHTITSNSTPNDPFATGLLRRVQVAAVEVPSSFGPRPQMQHVRLIRVPEEAKAREQSREDTALIGVMKNTIMLVVNERSVQS